MKYVDEFRDGAAAHRLAGAIAACVTRPWTLMEVCGGQTHALLRYGVDRLLPPQVTLLHGPGCPVCVTPQALIDQAIAIARRPEVILCSFGDMQRVPGSSGDLAGARASGADVRTVYSPIDAVDLAARTPQREVVFFAVGFETTAPAAALAALIARARGLRNYSLLMAQVLVPPAMEAILAAPGACVDGFLAAGHVTTVTGVGIYAPLMDRYRVPVVVTGFEPLDLLDGIHRCVRQLEAGRAEIEIQYDRAVRPAGNPVAQRHIEAVFEIVPRHWRGIGELPASGLVLRPEYADLDAARRFGAAGPEPEADTRCRAAEVLTGRLRPDACPAFGAACTPRNPLGVPMVSSEGACAAYYRYRTQPPA